MDVSSFPTKGNLIIAHNSLKMAKQGYDLLDRKRNLLIRKMTTLIDKAKKVQTQINTTFLIAYNALRDANVNNGIDKVEQVALAIPEEQGVQILFYSVMGVELPIIRAAEKKVEPHAGLINTNMTIDEAIYQFNKVKMLIYELAEVENGVYRLAANIKKTQKRANALKNVMIPKYTKLVSDIQNALEEKEREEFSRLKVIKRNKEGT